MASLTRGPPPLLKSSRTQSGLNVHTSPTRGNGTDSQRAFPRDTEILPYHAGKNRMVGDTPLNTPAQPIAPKLGGGGGPTATATATASTGAGGGMGRPIGRAPFGLAQAPHAATPGNTPSSLETMGRRIAGKLQGSGAKVGGGGTPGGGAAGVGGDTRIAPSYDHRLATHQEKPVPVGSPSSSMQRLQLVSPASTDQGRKADWPTSYDTDTNDGEGSGGQGIKEGQDKKAD